MFGWLKRKAEIAIVSSQTTDIERFILGLKGGSPREVGAIVAMSAHWRNLLEAEYGWNLDAPDLVALQDIGAVKISSPDRQARAHDASSPPFLLRSCLIPMRPILVHFPQCVADAHRAPHCVVIRPDLFDGAGRQAEKRSWGRDEQPPVYKFGRLLHLCEVVGESLEMKLAGLVACFGTVFKVLFKADAICVG